MMNKKGSKRAQAALEFLTTYGWAFFVILIMIGALSYFGVLSPDRFLPEKCLFGAGIGTCLESAVNGTYATFKLKNAMGNMLYLQGATMTNIRTLAGVCTGLNSSASVSIGGGANVSLGNGSVTAWQTGQTAEFFFPCALNVGERLQTTPVIIQYKLGGGATYIRSVEGDVALKRVS